jgi:hypothetical protein
MFNKLFLAISLSAVLVSEYKRLMRVKWHHVPMASIASMSVNCVLKF